MLPCLATNSWRLNTMPFKRRNYNQPSSGSSLAEAWSTGSWPAGQRQPKQGWSWDSAYKDGPCIQYAPSQIRRINEKLKTVKGSTVASILIGEWE